MMNVKKLARVLCLLSAVFLLVACTDYESEYEEEYGYLVDAGGDEDNSSSSIVYGTLTDSRDGQVYKTVTIGSQTWMAENLNYKTSDSYTRCYYDLSSSCDNYGRLYTWAAAVEACPSGWHLPSKEEWQTLLSAMGGSAVAGKKLKSTSGWNEGGNGTDAYGFSALPAGYRFYDGDFNYAGYLALFWSSSEDYSDDAYSMYLSCNLEDAVLDSRYKYSAFSVRCLQN